MALSSPICARQTLASLLSVCLSASFANNHRQLSNQHGGLATGTAAAAAAATTRCVGLAARTITHTARPPSTQTGQTFFHTAARVCDELSTTLDMQQSYPNGEPNSEIVSWTNRWKRPLLVVFHATVVVTYAVAIYVINQPSGMLLLRTKNSRQT